MRHQIADGNDSNLCIHEDRDVSELMNVLYIVSTKKNIRTLSQYKDRFFPGMGIPMLKIRRSRDRFIFNMGIPIPVRRHLYIEMAPCTLGAQRAPLSCGWSNVLLLPLFGFAICGIILIYISYWNIARRYAVLNWKMCKTGMCDSTFDIPCMQTQSVFGPRWRNCNLYVLYKTSFFVYLD